MFFSELSWYKSTSSRDSWKKYDFSDTMLQNTSCNKFFNLFVTLYNITISIGKCCLLLLWFSAHELTSDGSRAFHSHLHRHSLSRVVPQARYQRVSKEDRHHTVDAFRDVVDYVACALRRPLWESNEAPPIYKNISNIFLCKARIDRWNGWISSYKCICITRSSGVATDFWLGEGLVSWSQNPNFKNFVSPRFSATWYCKHTN